ncbi:hypothetical protein MAP00_004895 [Monascus purpureus]|nr:hypothetical protein MAP00_004895 [Monascus purpureus]
MCSMHACIIIIALLRIMIVPSLPSHCKRDPLLRNLLTAAALHPRLRLVSASMLQISRDGIQDVTIFVTQKPPPFIVQKKKSISSFLRGLSPSFLIAF